MEMSTVVLVFLAMAAYLMWFTSLARTLKGPRVWPLLGSLPGLLQNCHRMHDWIAENLRACGGTYQTCICAVPGLARRQGLVTVTCDPRNLEHVLKLRFDNYPKGPTWHAVFHDLLGDGIFNSDGDTWRFQRKTAALEFTTRTLRQAMARWVSRAIRLRLCPILDAARASGATVDLQDLLLRLTFDNICGLAFGLAATKSLHRPLAVSPLPKFQNLLLHRVPTRLLTVARRTMDKPPTGGQEKKTAPSDAGEHSSEYAPYPKIDRGDVDPPPRSTVAEATPSPAAAAAAAATTMPTESNPYVTPSPVPASSSKGTMDSMRDALGKWGKKVGEATKKAEDLAGNVWQHLKTGPSLADAAMGRIAQGTKVIAEGGYEKIFQQTFDTLPEEQLKKSYACYLSTSAGPVMGTLYLSTAKLAFCSDTPLSYKVGDQTEWSYYKVVIPLHQLRAVNPSTSKVNPSEKYIQIVSIDNHEFWFMGFVTYDSAVKSLQDALHESSFPG